MEIQAVVVTNPSGETATLEWRVLLGTYIKRVDIGGGEVDEVPVPKYGEVLASVVRPYEEFHAHHKAGLTLTEYVERHLPRPALITEERGGDLLTVAEAAPLTGPPPYSTSYLKDLCALGKIEGATKKGKTWLIPRSSLARFRRSGK